MGMQTCVCLPHFSVCLPLSVWFRSHIALLLQDLQDLFWDSKAPRFTLEANQAKTALGPRAICWTSPGLASHLCFLPPLCSGTLTLPPSQATLNISAHTPCQSSHAYQSSAPLGYPSEKIARVLECD